MAESVYYGLQKIGPADTLSTNDYSFGVFNVEVVDRLLYKISNNIFDQTHPINNPVSGPTLSTSTTGGSIPAGKTVRYKYTYVDSYGAETAASPESTITTPNPVAPPPAPSISVASTGGTLTYGTYFYAFSAYVTSSNNETTIGDRIFTTITGTSVTNVITLTLPTVPAGATGFVVYKRGPGQSVYYYIDTIDMSVVTPPTTWVDDGSLSQNVTRTPSNTNTTNSTNTITISLPGATPVTPVGYTWKIYRTYISGNYNSSLAHWATEETSTGSGIIKTSYEDIGIATTVGHPPARNMIFGDLLSGIGGSGVSVLQYDDLTATPVATPWSAVTAGTGTAVGDGGTRYVLNMGTGVGTAEQAYLTRTLAFSFDNVYSLGFKFVPNNTMMLDDIVQIAEVSNSVYKLRLFWWHYPNDHTMRYQATLEVDGTENYITNLTSDYALATSSIFDKSDIISGYPTIDNVEQYIQIIVDLDSRSRFITKPAVQIFVNGILSMIGDMNTFAGSQMYPATPFDVTVGSVGLLGYRGPFAFDATQSGSSFEIALDYVYTEQYPYPGREFNVTYDTYYSHLQNYKAHKQYESVTRTVLIGDSVRSNTTLDWDTSLCFIPIAGTSFYVEFQGLFKYAARSTEDIQFKIAPIYDTATPWTAASLQYQILPFDNVVGGVAGQIYDETDIVVINGDGESTFRMFEVRGFFYNNGATPFPSVNYDTMYLTVFWAKNADDATPGNATMATGSFVKVIDQI